MKTGKESKGREKKVRTEEEKKIERTFHHISSVLHTILTYPQNRQSELFVSHRIPFSASLLIKEMDIDPPV